MSQSAITTAFEDYLAQQLAAGAAVTLDQFVFANVPDLDPDAPIDRGETVPTDYVVSQQAVTLPGVINDNEVVYSVTMGTDVGDFDFNWIGLVNAATGLLGMVTHAPVQQKFKNADGQQGNTLTRSFLMEYDGAQSATNITTPAETWQIDFTARLSGMDERQRLENTDVYGDGAFFGDGFLVSGNPTDGYQIAAGSGYVGGLRVQLDAAQSLNVSAKPIQVYVDACWKGTLTSVWTVQQAITLASNLTDYTDPDGTAHHVFAVASVDTNGTVTDLRPKGSKDGQAASGCLQIAKNLSDLSDVDEAQKSLKLGDAARATLVDSPTDTTADRVLTVGYRGLGRNTGGIRLASMSDIDGSGFYVVHGVGFTDGTSTIGAPADSTAVQYALIVLNSYNGTYQLILYGGDDSWFAYFDVVNMAATDIVWSRNFTDSYPPTYTDTGAVQHMTEYLGAGSKQWGNPWIGFAAGDGDLPAQTDDFAVINISDPDTGGDGSYQILFDGDSSSNIANLNIFVRGIEVAGLLSAAKVVKLFHTGQPPTAAQTKAIPTDIVGKIVNGGSMATANIPGWWQVAVPDPSTVAGFPKYADGSYLYGYGYMFVEVVGDTWFQLFYGHHGANATRQNWGGGPDTTTDWFVTYNEANPPSYISGIRLANYGTNGSEGVHDSAKTVLTGIYANNGWDNPSTQEHRQIQYEIGSTWYNAAYV